MLLKNIHKTIIFLQAIKYYNDAAAHDHADALYNVGVFHAQGKGGLPIDIDIARTYFAKAAKLGQIQAQYALDLEKAHLRKNNNTSTITNKYSTERNLEKNEENDTRIKLNNNTLNINIGEILSTDFIAKCTFESPEYEKIIENNTQVFLDFLGLRESSPAVMITTNNCHVPC